MHYFCTFLVCWYLVLVISGVLVDQVILTLINSYALENVIRNVKKQVFFESCWPGIGCSNGQSRIFCRNSPHWSDHTEFPSRWSHEGHNCKLESHTDAHMQMMQTYIPNPTHKLACKIMCHTYIHNQGGCFGSAHNNLPCSHRSACLSRWLCSDTAQQSFQNPDQCDCHTHHPPTIPQGHSHKLEVQWQGH